MDFNDIIPTLKYAASTPTSTLLEQLRKELEDTYAKENVPPSSKDSQLASGARRDFQSSKYSGNSSIKNALAETPDEQKPGVITTPEAIKELEDKRRAIEKKLQELKSMQRINEFESKQQARQARVRNTLEKTGLLP